MTPFNRKRAEGTAQAVKLGHAQHTKYLGGGTNFVDLMRKRIGSPSTLADVTGLPATIKVIGDGGLNIDAAVSNTSLAEHMHVRSHYPVLSSLTVS